MIDDAVLVDSARAGDRGAMDTLLSRHYDRVYAVCRRMLNNDADAADTAQEAMIAIVRALPRFDGRSSFGTWAYRIATNASLDEIRRRRRRPVLVEERNEDGAAALAWLSDPDSAAATDAVVERAALAQALADVPEDFRLPMVMRDVGDLDYAEIAEQLGVPVGTVKSRIARGRSQLGAAYSARTGNQPPSEERPSG